MQLLRYPEVLFCGYRLPHPLEAKMTLKIQVSVLPPCACCVLRVASFHVGASIVCPASTCPSTEEEEEACMCCLLARVASLRVGTRHMVCLATLSIVHPPPPAEGEKEEDEDEDEEEDEDEQQQQHLYSLKQQQLYSMNTSIQ